MTAREAAVRTLGAYRRRGAWSDRFLGSLITKEELKGREAALAARICYGVLQNMALCDFYISQFSSLPLRRIEPVVLDILRISVYQIVFLTKIPLRASVDEGVKLVRKCANPGAVRFANAVLRKLSATAGNMPEPPGLAVKYSHPEWLVALFVDEFGPEGAEALLAANNCETPITAQVNTLKTDTDALLSKLERESVQAASHDWLHDCITLAGSGSPAALSSFADGDFYIQDAAARGAVLAADPKPGSRVLDACAAPGGKSFAAAIAMQNIGEIFAWDVHEKKLDLINRGSTRLGIDCVRTACRDARTGGDAFAGFFDTVIADVPCSGMGVIRKKPEIRYKSRESIAGLPALQLQILRNVCQCVRPGGVLLYSTCTLLPEENSGVIRRFLSENPAFAPEAFTLPGVAGPVRSGEITLYPHLHGTDGFYICKLRKTI